MVETRPCGAAYVQDLRETQADYDAFEAKIRRLRKKIPEGCPVPELICYAMQTAGGSTMKITGRTTRQVFTTT